MERRRDARRAGSREADGGYPTAPGFLQRPGPGMQRTLPGPSVPFPGPLQHGLPSPGLGEQVETRGLEPPPSAAIFTIVALGTFAVTKIIVFKIRRIKPVEPGGMIPSSTSMRFYM